MANFQYHIFSPYRVCPDDGAKFVEE